MSARVTRLTPENVNLLWDQVSDILSPAIALRPTHTPEDVRRLIMAHMAQVWVQWSEDLELQAVLVTEFAVYPQGVWVRVWLDGARPDCKQDDAALFEVLDKWRVENGCRGYEVIGRHGWLRRFPKLELEGQAMRWTF